MGLFSKCQSSLAFESPVAMRPFSRDYHSWRLALPHPNSARQASMRLRSLVFVHPIEMRPTSRDCYSLSRASTRP